MSLDKSSIKSAITAHYAALKGQTIEVKEWDATIHFNPLTIIERDELDALPGGENEMFVEVLIRKATNKAAQPIFTQADKGWLKRDAAPSLIRTVALRILTADLVDIETLGKPSAPKKEP